MRFRPPSSPAGAAAFAAVLLALPSSAPAAGVGAASPHSGELDVFLRHDGNGSGSDPNADSLVMLPRRNGTWQSPSNLGGSVHRDSEIAAASRQTDELLVAVRWSDNSLRVRSWTARDGWGGSWKQLASGITGGPSVAARGSSDYLISWRDASGHVAVLTGSPRSWSGATQLKHTTRVGTGPSVWVGSQTKIAFTGETTSNPYTTVLRQGGNPLVAGDWGGSVSLSAATAPPSAETPNAGVVRLWAAKNDGIWQYQYPTSTSSGRYVQIGWNAGGTGTVRPGESSRPNTPVSVWSDRLTSGSRQADAIWRTKDGCLGLRFKTSTSDRASWSVPTPASAPALGSNGRCNWPGRTTTSATPTPAPTAVPTATPVPTGAAAGKLPLVKRVDPTENADLAAADQAWRNVSGASRTALNWYQGRIASLIYHQGPDWATSWAPRNWHRDPWVYRKAMAYLASDHVADASAAQGMFVRRKSNGRLVALSYGCSSSGCPQPLLNITSSAARNFWLNGSSSAVAHQGACENQLATDGILDLLACTSGKSSTGRANAKGVWVDDVLPQLTTSDDPAALSFVADAANGKLLTNAEVLADLPFTPAQWAGGLGALLESLRSGIGTLRSQGALTAGQGKIVINYKWTSYGFGWFTSSRIDDQPAAARIIKAADLVELEGSWIDGGLAGGGPGTRFSFQRRQQFVDQVHGLGRNVLEEKVACGALPEFASAECSRQAAAQTSASDAAHRTTAQYNLASTLLNATPGDMIGDGTEYVGRSWDGYATDLGAPTSGRTYLDGAAGPQTRTFQKGRVIVVPPGYAGSTTFRVPVGSRWRPTGSNTLTTVSSGTITLAPRRGAVVLNP